MEERRIALVPGYEPDSNLSQVVHALHQNNFEVIVVNDGSSEDKNLIFTEVAREAALLASMAFLSLPFYLERRDGTKAVFDVRGDLCGQ